MTRTACLCSPLRVRSTTKPIKIGYVGLLPPTLWKRMKLHKRGGAQLKTDCSRRLQTRARMCIVFHQGQLVALCSVFSPVDMCMMDVEVRESRA